MGYRQYHDSIIVYFKKTKWKKEETKQILPQRLFFLGAVWIG